MNKFSKWALKAGIIVIIFTIVYIVFGAITWLVMSTKSQPAWQGFNTSFVLPILITIIGAVGVSKWLEKFKGNKK